MANRLIKDSDSAGVIECQGAITLAKLLQSLSRDTRARLVGATSPDARGVITVVIAGGLAEVQHATEHVRALSGVSDVVFFARPDADAMSILLKSLNIADEVTEIKKASSHVRQVAELDITDMANWNVHELRRYARSTEGFPLHGRQISKAKREELIRMLTPLIFPSSSPLAYPPKDMMPS
jgi:microcompartment protein CcmL/EutN